jgi:hypothetical protein
MKRPWHANWTAQIVGGIVLAGFLAGLWAYAGYRQVAQEAPIAPAQQVRLCAALQSPQEGVTRACLQSFPLYRIDLDGYCQVHPTPDAQTSCLGRISRLLRQ